MKIEFVVMAAFGFAVCIAFVLMDAAVAGFALLFVLVGFGLIMGAGRPLAHNDVKVNLKPQSPLTGIGAEHAVEEERKRQAVMHWQRKPDDSE